MRSVLRRRPPYTIGTCTVNVRGAVVRVPALLLTSVRTFTTFPTANGPSAFPLADVLDWAGLGGAALLLGLDYWRRRGREAAPAAQRP